MSFRRSGSSSTSRMSPDIVLSFVVCPASAAARAAAAAAARAAAAAAATPATAARAVAQEAALHLAERLELLQRGVGLLLFLAHRALATHDLRLQHHRQLLDGGRAR